MSKALKQQSAEAPALEEVTLLKNHTHQGVNYKAGATISVNAPDKAWLIDQDIIAADAAQSN